MHFDETAQEPVLRHTLQSGGMAWVDAEAAGAIDTSVPAAIAITAAATPPRAFDRMLVIGSSLMVARSGGSGLATGFTRSPTRPLPPGRLITRMESA
ncbi:hypothetical protein DL991_25155 [Amycolatopsis sp. WAC 01375]|uniref:hypothetical protein n=1 Tax=unclassified Amycolatopsis TaxID=2618356 RepID=UPI000F79F919|nr:MULTISPECIES: hypothetical protein [unclassified Amycolatopsis]RSM76495.1 hypothetical protein DL991_25155 [Amycolatopsis sp. WAC 01375]RSN33284.1 hypothetical protein DL990_14945 [Amycolatopsis sp. WAC 01416]